MHIQAPFIEILNRPLDRLYGIDSHAQEVISWRNGLSRIVCEELDRAEGYSNEFYYAIGAIMAKQPRLALYLPFSALCTAPDEFRDAYLDAWKECWSYRDIRECFNQGDIYERTARRGEPERIVKAMHLLPWLVEYGYLDGRDVLTIVRFFMHQDALLCWSTLDALEVLEKRSLISRTHSFKIRELLSCIPPRMATPELVSNTPARQQWLHDRNNNYGVDDNFKLRNPEGPYLLNLDEDVQMFAPPEGQITLIGGSRLKGYGRPKSDYDIYHYDIQSGRIVELAPLCDDISNVAHLILCTAWMGQNEDEVTRAQHDAAINYISLDRETKEHCLSRMEMDLLQFRLMHKGFPAAHRYDCALETKQYESIDGASAFYDDRYRKLATKIFVKYLWLP